MYEIILGREEKEKEKYGIKGSVLIGKQYVKIGQITSLAQPVYLDLNRAHVVFVAGKRGSGKSYCMSVIAEGIAIMPEEYRKRISVILLDTMGIFWTMKYPNRPDESLLKEWGFEGKGIENLKIYTPVGFYKRYKEIGIPTDVPFAIKPSELSPEDWWLTFDLESNDPLAVFIERIVLELKEKGIDYDIKDIIDMIVKDEKEEKTTKNAAENRFRSADRWGLFAKEGTPIRELAKGGQITVLDLSPYAIMPNGWKIKHLTVGIVSRRLFIERMAIRKEEEFASIHKAIHYLVEEDEEEEDETKEKMPIVWLEIDEAHEFLPSTGKTASTEALITLLREGRQPGIAMVLVTQQPGKIHTDAMTQSDILLAHRLTAKLDTDALSQIIQSYLRGGLDKELDQLPRVPGACLAVDDVNERIFPMRIRPKFSWHGGGAPKIIVEKKGIFEL